MTTEPLDPPSTLPAESAPPAPQPLLTSLMFALYCPILGGETQIHSRVFNALYLAALCAPLVILITTYLRRRFFSARLPVRWPKDAPIIERLRRLILTMFGVGLLCMAWSLIARHSWGRRDPLYTMPHDAFWFLMAWIFVLSAYVADRKPLPPPRKPISNWRDPDSKPIHSDHWGSRTNPAQ